MTNAYSSITTSFKTQNNLIACPNYPVPNCSHLSCHPRSLGTNDLFSVLLLCLLRNVIYIESCSMWLFKSGFSHLVECISDLFMLLVYQYFVPLYFKEVRPYMPAPQFILYPVGGYIGCSQFLCVLFIPSGK